MPQLLTMITPEKWFRTQGRDLFEIRLAGDIEDLPVKLEKIPAELKEWLARCLPHRPLMLMALSEHLGWASGPVMYGIYMDENDLKAWCDRWEDSSGKSIDPRWQCWQWRHQDWLARFDRIQTSVDAPPADTSCRWLLCDAGLIWLTGRYFKTQGERKIYRPRPDDWWIVRQRFPDLHIGEGEIFLMGTLFYKSTGETSVIFEKYEEKNGDIDTVFDMLREDEEETVKKRIQAALALPENTRIEEWCP
jgi:hypothetical protein